MNGPPIPAEPPRLPDAAYSRMALVLRVGLGTAVVLLLGALFGYFALHPGARWSASAPNLARQYLSVPALLGGLGAGNPVAYLTLGLLVLVATPIVRVLSGLYYFERNGEATMTSIALAVFLMLLFGLFVLGPLVR
jgi:uncharacterized membrane protein